MSILLSDNPVQEMIIYAGDMLKTFVKEFSDIYGKESVIFNVHCLLHLVQDSMKYGSLNSVSAFPFESYTNTYIVFEKFGSMLNFFIYPVESSKLGIYKVRKLSQQLQVIPISDIEKKYVLLPCLDSVFVAMPMLHGY